MIRRIRPLARRAGRTLVLSAIVFAAACSSDTTSPGGDSADFARGGQQGPDYRAAASAQARHSERLLAIDGVEGHGLALDSRGHPTIRVFTLHGAVGGVPRALDGIPVELEVTGRISAILPNAKGGKPGGGSGSPSPTSRFDRPVPIGISIGNVGECSAGTLGARVKSGNNVFVLSNNHVLALENEAPNNSAILQPGRYDTNCAINLADQIASLGQYVPINYSGNNTVDAALAPTTTGDVGKATVAGGYGIPNSQAVAAQNNMAVQKCGRTTGCTKGTVTAINATINVQYSGGVARFVNQVVISGRRGPFSKAGDSGSLIVTDNANANPVALLFAGSQTVTIGNPIGAVLSALNVTIDGK